MNQVDQTIGGQRVKQIEEKLKTALNPISLVVQDDSHLHAGHAGAQSGKGAFYPYQLLVNLLTVNAYCSDIS